MSKSRGNVINPDTIIKQYGADTLRLYEMFMGPFEQMIPWDTKGVVGCRRFVEKIYNLANKEGGETNENLKKILHKTIKKVSEDVELLKFNTAVSSMMEFVNACFAHRNPGEGVAGLDKSASAEGYGLAQKDLSDFLKILSPFAPHLAEELWAATGSKEMCCQQKWPKYDEKLIEEKNVTLIVQINGKVRDKMEVKANISQNEAEKLVLKSEKIKLLIGQGEVKKIVFVPGKLINIVV